MRKNTEILKLLQKRDYLWGKVNDFLEDFVQDALIPSSIRNEIGEISMIRIPVETLDCYISLKCIQRYLIKDKDDEFIKVIVPLSLQALLFSSEISLDVMLIDRGLETLVLENKLLPTNYLKMKNVLEGIFNEKLNSDSTFYHSGSKCFISMQGTDSSFTYKVQLDSKK